MYKKIIMLVLLCLVCLPLTISAQTGFVSIAGGASSPDLVNIRKGPSSNSEVIDQIYFGTKVDIIGTEGNYYKVNYGGRTPGYIYNTVVELVPSYSNDPDYCNYLKSIGFDETYCPYLTYLHQKHPNWTFTALRINHNFDDIIAGEDGQNYIQLATQLDINYFKDKYIISTSPSEGSNWYTATRGINAYFLDPRNFLNERFIFMFEDLSCNENSYWYQNKDKAITTMANIFTADSYLTLSTNPNYLEMFYSAGVDAKVSPIHLAARVKQEGGANENYGPITGTVTSTYLDYSVYGYYNYYNIGAYGSNPQMAGLLYACGSNCGKTNDYGRPWDTREKAIRGGAQKIGSEYISVGQSSLYLQKFDVIGNQLFTHQYMTNVTAPLSEGISTYNSYVKNRMVSNGTNIAYNEEVPFNFSIPVYNNMGIAKEMPTVLDGVNYLSQIYINNSPISNFDPDITDYRKYVIDTTTKAVVTYDKNNSAIVNGALEYNLVDTETKVSLEVVALNGSKRVYNITIVKVADTKTADEIVNNIGVKVSDNILSEIKLNTAISTITSSIERVSPLAEVTVLDRNGNQVSSTDLKTGYKVIIKTVTGDNKEYRISIIGEPSGDGAIDILDLLKVQKQILGDATLENFELKACDTNNDNVVDILDLLRIKKHILGDINLGD